MDPTRCPHCHKRMQPVVTDDGRTGLECLKCDAVKPRLWLMRRSPERWADLVLCPKAGASCRAGQVRLRQALLESLALCECTKVHRQQH
jgi:hypothetical protein